MEIEHKEMMYNINKDYIIQLLKISPMDEFELEEKIVGNAVEIIEKMIEEGYLIKVYTGLLLHKGERKKGKAFGLKNIKGPYKKEHE